MFEWRNYAIPVATVGKSERGIEAKMLYLLNRRIKKQERALMWDMRNVFGSCEEQHQRLEAFIRSFDEIPRHIQSV